VYRRFLHEPVPGYEAIIAKPFENRFLLEQIPDFYERLKSSYDEKFYQQEVLGENLNLGGATVYHAFRRADHVRELERDPTLPLLWALDFNVDPMCSVVAQMNGEVVYGLDEITISRATTEDACEECQRRFPRHYQGVIVYGDATGHRMQTSGTNDYEVVRNYFRREAYPNVDYRVPRSNPPVRERVELVNAKLRSAAGEIRMYVERRCRELIRDFEEVSYRQETTIIDKDKNPKRTHLSDALGYLVWQEWREWAGAGEKAVGLVS